MKNIRAEYLISVFIAIFSAVFTYALQRYRMLELEECYIFVYDTQYIFGTLVRPGGAALLLASFLTQFMLWPWSGPLLVGVLYGCISLALCKITRAVQIPEYAGTLSLAPVICLFLCLENNSYKFQGHAAVLFTVLLLWLYYTRIFAMPTTRRLVWGCVLTISAYLTAGSAALVFAVGAAICDMRRTTRHTPIGLIYVAVVALYAYISYRMQLVPTLKRAFTPAMYYEWDTTAYMMLYVWIAIVAYLLVYIPRHKRSLMLVAVLSALSFAAQIAVGGWLYQHVHAPSVYRAMQQRYYAKTQQWQKIIDLDYGYDPTPFTSYRILAMAHTGVLDQQLESTRPFIDYFMKNKTLVKKEDLQVLSDMYYDCDFMAACRRYAFDTNIVTPGLFNPYETKKLAEMNILTGDYAVAEKYLAQLQSTLFYRNWACEKRKLLYNDAAVEADTVLGIKRAVIPSENDYLTPKGTLRDLRHIIKVNPNQQIARQILDAFIVLTHYKDDPETDSAPRQEHIPSDNTNLNPQ